MQLYHQTCTECSQLITQRYSTSFSMGIRAFAKKFRAPIYAIYGFVRFADEIVDTFHDYPKAELLQQFRLDTYKAIESRISLNPVLNAFQLVVHKYQIERELIDAFLDSMEMDLHFSNYQATSYDTYIYGSAEVIGLMCLRVFCESNSEQYEQLKAPAQKLGSAFQKVNFLRDMASDYEERGRVYFPEVDFRKFTNEDKKQIELDIKKDFDEAYLGILNLPKGARLGVYVAYVYYLKLFHKISKLPAVKIKKERIRINNSRKILLLFSSTVKNQLNWI